MNDIPSFISPLSIHVLLKHVIHHCLSQWKLSTSDSWERLWTTLNYSRYKAFISRDSSYSLWNLKLNLFVGKQINACLLFFFFITMHIDIATDALLIIKLNISVWKYITERKKVFFFIWRINLVKLLLFFHTWSMSDLSVTYRGFMYACL